jgi:diguanylate cyclase (GGDEF)-like protein
MIDADYFKAYNDLYGHVQGDQLLKALGAAITGTLRPAQDLGARYGGDEFAVLLPTTREDGAVRVAERIRSQFARECVRVGGPVATLSVGVASLMPRDDEAAEVLVEAADAALYSAKQNGRDRIASHGICDRRQIEVAV